MNLQKNTDSDPAIDCLIVSVGRSASTAIYSYLNEACLLNLPTNKEPHHWCDIERFSGRYDLLNDLYIKEDKNYFREYFSSKKIIDASVGYFFYIDEVIKNLESANQKPKVVFLYREPVSRAASLFNELKKKKLTKTENINLEICLEKDDGLWWENYFDNVNYYDNFKSMELYFDEILAVNYDAFDARPEDVFSSIADFIGVHISEEIDYFPINSSSEANLVSGVLKFEKILKFIRADRLPINIKRAISNHLVILLRSRKKAEGLKHSLSNNMLQFELFRNYINEEDVFCLKK